ncbi:MAG: hypothetical protein CUN56_04460 [Phototrophicales bacterium]|nr:MAG: hypothetical protein CUN56_04460 [Phototrophicales bacterium]RMG76932.1 MAG: hypothetical protein D6711_02930 [Chloroflexota bacterium]
MSNDNNRKKKRRNTKSRSQRNRRQKQVTTATEPSPLQLVTGDIMTENKVKAYAIPCNIEGVINTQIGVRFRDKYPNMAAEYIRLCEAKELKPGGVFMWKERRDNMVIFNIGVYQDQFLTLVDPKEIESAFFEIRRLAEQEGIDSIAMPPIGAGLGALRWDSARRSLEKAFRGWNGVLYVYIK